MNINVVVLSGRLTRDPEMKTVGDQALAKMRLATDKSTKVNGQWESSSMYFDIDVWGRTAEICGQYLTKGSKVTIKGRLDWREWEDQSGNKRQSVSIVADGVELPTKKEAEQARAGTGSNAAAPTSSAPPQQDFREQAHADAAQTFQEDGDSDIPFLSCSRPRSGVQTTPLMGHPRSRRRRSNGKTTNVRVRLLPEVQAPRLHEGLLLAHQEDLRQRREAA